MTPSKYYDLDRYIYLKALSPSVLKHSIFINTIIMIEVVTKLEKQSFKVNPSLTSSNNKYPCLSNVTLILRN